MPHPLHVNIPPSGDKAQDLERALNDGKEQLQNLGKTITAHLQAPSPSPWELKADKQEPAEATV